MKRGGMMFVLLAGGTILCGAAAEPAADATAKAADTPQNPYQAVVERNVFGLKPPTPPPDPEANKPPMPKITLTGIITVGGGKRALMKTPPPVGAPTKPGEPPRTEQGYILAIGEREGEIEVLEIDEKAGSVKVNYGGSVTELTFDKDGVKTPPTPGPGAVPVPGAPPGMRAAMPLPGAMGGPRMGATPLPARPLRLPAAGVPVTPQSSGTAGSSAMPEAAVGAGLSAMPQAAVGAGPPAANFRTAEEGALFMEVNYLENKPLEDAGLSAPLPRHPMVEEALGSGTEPEAAPTPAPVPAPVTLPPLPPGGPQQFPPQAPQ